MDVIPELQTYGSWGVLGLLAFLLLRTFTTTLPQFREAMKDQQQMFDGTLRSQRQDFAAMLRGERRETLGVMTTIKEELKQSLSEIARRCPGGKTEGG